MIHPQRQPTSKNRHVDSYHYSNSNGYNPHRYGALSSHDSSPSQWPDLPEDDLYYLPTHSYATRPTCSRSSKSYSSTKRLSFQASKRPDSYHELDKVNYHASYTKSNPSSYTLDEKTILSYPNHPRRHSTYHHEPNDYYSHADSLMMDQSNEDEDEITPLEAEALRNAELNKVVKAIISTATGTHDSKKPSTEPNKGLTMNSPTLPPPPPPPNDSPIIPTQQQQQQQHGPIRKKKHDKGILRLASFFRRIGSTKKRQETKQQQKGTIQTMWVTTPLGDIMNEQQQQEILLKLEQQPQESTEGKPTPNEDATKVALLDHIWVFRSTEDSTVWTGFDYGNQLLLSQHVDDDQGIELYDTHIRQGQLPILVIPKRQVCFYAPLDLSDKVASLQVTCLPNSKNTQFVYRCGGPLA